MTNPSIDRPPFPDVSQVRELPVQHSMVVPPEWEDLNGHVNVQYYLTLYELGGYEVLQEVGIDIDGLNRLRYGLFDFEHHLSFRAEIHVGDRVSTFNRLIDMNNKRFQGMYFIVNDTREQLACTVEYLTAGVNLETRRTGPFPPQLQEGVSALLNQHRQLQWPAPVCGSIRV